ncbi:MAG TPA: hypothetical protein VL359_05620, partial [bacterium]|nr:hypothetical protein [bacterium]
MSVSRWIPQFVLVLALAAALPAAAQSSKGTGAASQAPVTNPAIAPGEPQIVMPQVILNLEDLSVESVQAQLPPEEDLLPPVRPVPVLTEGELAVGEPVIPAAPVEGEGAQQNPNQRLLSSEIQLGA